AALSETRVIGVLGTNATVRQPYVDRLAAEFAADCTVLRHGSAELVELAEASLRGETLGDDRFRAVLAGLFDQPGGDRLDVIVNACTHFPLVADRLASAAPHPVRFVDGSAGIARRTAVLTAGDHWPARPQGRAVFTRLDDQARALAPALARFGLDTIEAL
ncbi:MAG: glutamate racemase, partial [Sphingomonas sp.]